ncbi:UNVERIFIED_CONTAM: hypothetical protein Slati_4303100 [Sesamum latifolium]|uniref:Uncharacterized protein n=1 Tax=Sesamum latifolium TaxID=2727402 RepID=A0AAW2TDV3_9LAMI
MYFAARAKRASNLETGFLARDLKKLPSKSPWEKALAFTSCVAAVPPVQRCSRRASHCGGTSWGSGTGTLRLLLAGGTGTGISSSSSSFGASASGDGATRGGAAIGTCSRRAAATTCWIALSKAGDSSSVEVSVEVLRRGGSATGSVTLGGEVQEGG